MSEDNAQQGPLPVDTLDMAAYKTARDDGKGAGDSVSVKEQRVQKAAQPNGKEDFGDYKTKRDKGSRGGFQARVDGLIKARATLEQQLASERATRQELETRLGTTKESGSETQESESPESEQPSTKRTADDPRTLAAREKFPDYDKVMKSASNIRIADEAAKFLHASPLAANVSYFIAKTPELAAELSKLPPDRQVKEIDRITWDVASHEPGASALTERIAGASSPEQLEALKDKVSANPHLIHAISANMQELADLSNGHEVFAALASDPELAQHIASLPKSKQGVAMGRISASLERGSETHKTSAPAPIRPVIGGKTRSASPLDQMDYSDFKKARQNGRVR
jgi:hypothetical protein